MDLRERPDQLSARHPWETARARFFCGVLAERVEPGPAPLRVLDVGAGDGFFARELSKALSRPCAITCFDLHYKEDDMRALQAALPGSTFCNTLPDGQFDVVLLLDVIEHVANDSAFLRELCDRCVAQGALVLVSVPAFMALYSAHDVALGHVKRYTAPELREVLQANGLTIERAGGLFHSLLLPRALEKLRELARGVRSRPDASAIADHAATDLGAWSAGPALTALVGGALAIDNRVSRAAAALGVSLPGLSVWALTRKAG